MAKIFIPETCRVGFQSRQDTFTGKLAYVIYYDADKKLRKETSWKGWCDAKIDAFDFSNTPTSGFVLNKGIHRFNWSGFGSGRSMIRIYDPRGIEFEVTPENLIGLLMHCDCSKREIQDDLVYAWCGTELMLLPCSSEEYEQAKNFSLLQGKSVSAKELKEGLTYTTTREEKLVYLGRRMWYSAGDSYRERNKGRIGKNEHIFCDMEGQNFRPVKSVSDKIAAALTDHCHDQFATWVDNYLKTEESSKIVRWIKKPLDASRWEGDWSHWNFSVRCAVELGGIMYLVDIQQYSARSSYWPYEHKNELPLKLAYTLRHRVKPDGSKEYYSYSGSGYATWRESEERKGTLIEDRSIFFDLYAVFENGLEKEWS